MEPIPETREALDELGLLEAGEHDDLATGLVRLCARAQVVVPELLGVSISRLEVGLTFTLVSTSMDLAALDAVQYLEGGPCAEVAHATPPVDSLSVPDLLDEERWRLFAEASSAAGIRSTLTLPLRLAEGGTGSVNLYAAAPGAFTGHEDELAHLFGGQVAQAVNNADLGFLTLSRARSTPQRVRDLLEINTAIGLLAAREDLEIEEAEQRFWDAAARAGVPPVQLARVIIGARRRRDGE